VLRKGGVSANTAVPLSAAPGTSECFRLGLQANYDLEKTRRVLGKKVVRIERIAA
jgi:plasmid maintenance system antidote protein VapI